MHGTSIICSFIFTCTQATSSHDNNSTISKAADTVHHPMAVLLTFFFLPCYPWHQKAVILDSHHNQKHQDRIHVLGRHGVPQHLVSRQNSQDHAVLTQKC